MTMNKAGPAPRPPAQGHTMPVDPGDKKVQRDMEKLESVRAGVDESTVQQARKEGDDGMTEKSFWKTGQAPGARLQKGDDEGGADGDADEKKAAKLEQRIAAETGDTDDGDGDDGDNAEKSLVGWLRKSQGEGTRGGHIIGHTSKGVPIYASAHLNAEKIAGHKANGDDGRANEARGQAGHGANPHMSADDHKDAYRHLMGKLDEHHKTPPPGSWDEKMKHLDKGIDLLTEATHHGQAYRNATGKTVKEGLEADATAEYQKQMAAQHAKLKEKHGGADVGKTNSGKSVRGHFDHPDHGEFAASDHADAAAAHRKAAGTARTDATSAQREKRGYHLDEAKKHEAAEAALRPKEAAALREKEAARKKAATSAKRKATAAAKKAPVPEGHVRIAARGGPKDVKAHHTAGLYHVHDDAGGKGFAVTHGPSGMRAGGFPDKGKAIDYANHLHAKAGDAGKDTEHGKVPGKPDMDKIAAAAQAFRKSMPGAHAAERAYDRATEDFLMKGDTRMHNVAGLTGWLVKSGGTEFVEPSRPEMTDEEMAKQDEEAERIMDYDGLADANPDLAKSGGPYIGPHGGKWADPAHKIPWDEKKHAGKPFPKAKPHDAEGARELTLFTENDGGLHRQMHEPIRNNLVRKMASGKYDHAQATKLYGNLMDAASKKYNKEHGNGDGHAFDAPTRMHAAKQFADQFVAEAKNGEHDHRLNAADKKRSGGSLKEGTVRPDAPKDDIDQFMADLFSGKLGENTPAENADNASEAARRSGNAARGFTAASGRGSIPPPTDAKRVAEHKHAIEAHGEAATAHDDAAYVHEAVGNKDKAAEHKQQAQHHRELMAAHKDMQAHYEGGGHRPYGPKETAAVMKMRPIWRGDDFRRSMDQMSTMSDWLRKAGGGIPGATTEFFDGTSGGKTLDNTRVDAGGKQSGIPGAEDCSEGQDPSNLTEGEPSIEPGKANGQWLGDGAKEGAGKAGQQVANTRSGKGSADGIPGASGESVKTTTLSADDDRADSVEPVQETVPEKDKTGAGRDLNKGSYRDVQDEIGASLLAANRARRAELTPTMIVKGGARQPAQPAAPVMAKAINGVIYSDTEDRRIEALTKAQDPFYAGGAPSQMPSVGALRKGMCGSCGAAHPAFLTVCPACGFDGSASMAKSASAPVAQSARLAPRVEQALYLPNGSRGLKLS